MSYNLLRNCYGRHDIDIFDSQQYLVLITNTGDSILSFSVYNDARVNLSIILIGDAAGDISLSLSVTLVGGGATADVRVLGLAQSSRIGIVASMQIAPGAQQTDGQLSMRGLLLDDDASIAMTPGLDVAANDVKASHGASIDRVDPHERFYLESRGLSTSEAHRMIWRGIVTDMVSRYDHELARDTEWMEGMVSQLL